MNGGVPEGAGWSPSKAEKAADKLTRLEAERSRLGVRIRRLRGKMRRKGWTPHERVASGAGRGHPFEDMNRDSFMETPYGPVGHEHF